MRPPLPQAELNGLLHPRVLVQPQETIRAEVDDPAPLDHNLPAGPHLIDHKIFQVRVSMLLAKPLDDSNERVLPERLIHFVHRAEHVGFVSFDSANASAANLPRLSQNFTLVARGTAASRALKPWQCTIVKNLIL